MNKHEKQVTEDCMRDFLMEAGATEEECIHISASVFAVYCFVSGKRKEEMLKIASTCYESQALIAEALTAETH